MLAVNLSYVTSIVLEYVPSILGLLEVFIRDVEICQVFFFASVEMIICYIMHKYMHEA